MREYLFPVKKIINKFSSIKSKKDLQNFVQERSAHVTQTTLYGYLKTRIGTRYVLMLDDEKYSESINIAKWNIYVEAISDLTLYVFSYLTDQKNLKQNDAKEVFNNIISDECKNGLDKKISEVFSTEKIIPSAGQGIIALQCRQNDKDTIALLEKVNHKETYQRAHAERNVLKVLEGDCETAIGVHSIVENNKITLEVELFSLDGSQRFYEKKSSEIENAKKLGKEVGQILKIKSNNNYKK